MSSAAEPSAKAAAVLAAPHGRTIVVHGGEPLSPATSCDYIMRDPDAWGERIREFAANGVKVFMLNVPHRNTDFFDSSLWPDDGVFLTEEPEPPYGLTLAAQVATIVAAQPKARFIIRTWLSPPKSWAQKYPGDIQTDEDGTQYRQASLASPRYIEGLNTYLQTLVTLCESQSWGDRIVGYAPAPFGEGALPLTIAGKMFDCSAANEKAFGEWVRKRYPTPEHLRTAWGDPAITFDTVKVPRDREWHSKRLTAVATFGGKPIPSQPSNGGVGARGLFHFIEPANAAFEQDYCRFQRDAFMHWIGSAAAVLKAQAASLGRSRIVLFDVCKQPLMGWQILSAFDGVGDAGTFPNILQLSGSFDMEAFLDNKNLDGLWTPADYHARTVGFALDAEGPADSIALRGKLFLVENEARTFVGAGVNDQGAFRDVDEVEAGLLRNESLALSRNLGSYWCNVGSSYFHDPKIQSVIAKMVPMLDRSVAWPHKETTDAIAIVVDDTSPMFENFTSGLQSLAVIWQRILGVAHCGVPYRIVMLGDLKRDNFPDYKVYLFPNLFCVNDEVLDLLHRKVLRRGHVAIFGPATGITDGVHLTAEPASKLLGVKMELIPRTTQRHVILQEPRGQSHPMLKALPASLTFGDSLAYGPTLVPADGAVLTSGAQSLGQANTCFFINRPGLFIKDIGKGATGASTTAEPRGENDAAMIWSVAIPFPSNFLREAARHAGCNIWSEEDDIVYASDSFVSLHTVRAGHKVIHLPRPRTVRNALTDTLIGNNLRDIHLDMQSVETRLFLLE